MRKILLTIPIIVLLLTLTLWNNSVNIRVVFASPTDVYGNDINYVEIWQFNGTTWVLKANFTASGGSVRINDNQQVKFNVGIRLNSTLASSTAEAVSYTRVLMNITFDGTFVWQNVELNNTSCVLVGGFYYLVETGTWNTNLPVAGKTYACTVLYQAYY